MGENPSEVRARIEQARARLGADVEALVHEANLPKRLRERAVDRLERIRNRFASDPRTQAVREAADDLRQGRRREGARKLAAAARRPAAVGLVMGAGGVAISRVAELSEHRLGDDGRSADRNGGRSGENAESGSRLSLVARPAMIAALQVRRAKKAGRRPGAKQFAGYVAVGVATTAVTKWAIARIDRTAPPAT